MANAEAAVKRATALYDFHQAYGDQAGQPQHARTDDMIRLRNDAAEAAELVESQKEKGELGIPSTVREGLLPALEKARDMLEDGETRPALDQAYAYSFVHETVRQITEAHGKIDAILNPREIKFEGDQATFDFD